MILPDASPQVLRSCLARDEVKIEANSVPTLAHAAAPKARDLAVGELGAVSEIEIDDQWCGEPLSPFNCSQGSANVDVDEIEEADFDVLNFPPASCSSAAPAEDEVPDQLTVAPRGPRGSGHIHLVGPFRVQTVEANILPDSANPNRTATPPISPTPSPPSLAVRELSQAP